MHFDSLTIRHDKIALVTEFGDRVGNGVVQTTIKRSKLVYLEWRIALIREIRNCLA